MGINDVPEICGDACPKCATTCGRVLNHLLDNGPLHRCEKGHEWIEDQPKERLTHGLTIDDIIDMG